jgi:histidine ammonia-lyase
VVFPSATRHNPGMTVVLTGHGLTLADVVSVARHDSAVSIDPGAVERMTVARAVVERALARGDEVYGLTTGLGVAKTTMIEPSAAAAMQWGIVRSHLFGQGRPFAADVVRAATLVLANGFAAGWSGVRPELVPHLIEALNRRDLPEVHSLGSVGQADLAPLAELAVGVLDGVALAPGEALALLSSNAFATGHAALVLADVGVLLDALDASGALSLEALGANLGMLHSAVAATRPFPGLRTSLDGLRTQLDGSALWSAGASRNLQDPLTFRGLPQVNGTARDAHTFAATQLGIELNASQNNPLVVVDEDRMVSVANFDALALATALDVVRIGLGPAVLASSERAVKLLDTSWSGLPRGLVDGASDGLSYLGIAAQSLATEATLLAAPVSLAVASTAHAEGIEDRAALASLAARRVEEMADLTARVVAIELAVAAQAIEIRDARSHASAVGHVLELIRGRVPKATADRPDPPELEPVVDLVRSGMLSMPLDRVARDI